MPALAAWHDYFMPLGGAAATLIGAMFVVISLGIGFLTPERAAGIRTFVSATVANLATALFGALLTMAPGLDWTWFGAMIGLAGLIELGFALHILLRFRQHDHTVRSDWFWYAILPPIAYLLFVAAAASAWHGVPISLDLFAAALALMLAAGIRNAWDIIVFFVTQAPGSR